MNIFKSIAEHYSFDYELGPPSDGGRWGNQVSPGVFDGLIGDLQHDRSDVGWANLYVRLYEPYGVVDFADPYTVDYRCFLVSERA